MQVLLTQGLKRGLLKWAEFPLETLSYSGILPLLYQLAYVEISS